MGETGQVFDYCTLEKKASDPIQFRSGHESDAYSSPLPSPRSPYGSPGPCLNTIDKREKKPSKRTRKISLFSQFHFNARSDDKHGKSRKVSAPTISSLVPCSTMTLGYTEADILPDLSSDSSTSSVQSQQSSSSLPVLLTVDNASFLSRPKSSGTCSANDKETASIRYIINFPLPEW